MSLTIGVQLTTRCNLACAHCYVDGPGDDIPLATVAGVADAARRLDCNSLLFTGGEPILHSHFADIADLLRDRGLRFTLVSNAWSFEALRAELVRCRGTLRHIAFSLDGPGEDGHDQNRGAGSYRRVVAAARFCAQERIPFGLRMTVTRFNLPEIDAMARLADDLSATDLALVPLMPTPRAAEQEWLLSTDDLKQIVSRAVSLRRRIRPRIVLTAGYFSLDPLRPCPAFAGESVFVTARGEVSMCCQLADYVGGEGQRDIVGNLDRIVLDEGVLRVRNRIARLAREKARRMEDGSLGYLDHHPCWYCLKRLGKVEWMRRFPGSEWSRDLTDSGSSLDDPASAS